MKLSGFPEWLPEQQLIENEFISIVRNEFELWGFSPIHTRSVEPLDVLLRKGETDKEVYGLNRLQGEGEGSSASLGLHFDLTIPFARYVSENRGQLKFPFKRYQIQKAWRGERPQFGRFREFTQADIDVVADGPLSLAWDAEMANILLSVISKLPIPAVRLCINNRKLLEGFMLGLGITDTAAILRVLDKLDKLARTEIERQLLELGLSSDQVSKCLQLTSIKSTGTGFRSQVEQLGVQHELLSSGLDELEFVMKSVSHWPEGSVLADLHIARGLDYYTGTVYEGQLQGFEKLGAVCSGGRYDNLLGDFGKAKMPGIGVSIGVTRILSGIFDAKAVAATRSVPTCVVIVLMNEESRMETNEIARQLRVRGISCEVYHEAVKIGKQIDYAAKRGIPFVWFPAQDGADHQVKDIRSGEQLPASLQTWLPPQSDAKPTVTIKADSQN